MLSPALEWRLWEASRSRLSIEERLLNKESNDSRTTRHKTSQELSEARRDRHHGVDTTYARSGRP